VIKVTKQKYHHRLVQRYLHEIDNPPKEKTSVSVLDAIHYITAAWQDVTKETVHNCFKKAGFFFIHDDNSIDLSDPEIDISQTAEDRIKLQNTSILMKNC